MCISASWPDFCPSARGCGQRWCVTGCSHTMEPAPRPKCTHVAAAGDAQVVDKTILHTHNLDKFLWFPPEQRPLVLQLGGSDPETLAAAAAAAYRYGGPCGRAGPWQEKEERSILRFAGRPWPCLTAHSRAPAPEGYDEINLNCG